MRVLTAAQMRAIEQAAIDSGEVTGLELMERAGRAILEAVFEWRPELAATPGKVIVLCGPGNNGGDGFVTARLFKALGWDVEVQLYGDEAKQPAEAAENCRRWREMGEVVPGPALLPADLYIDALFGGGLSRPLPRALEGMSSFSGDGLTRKIMAIDAPSGVCLDSGRPLEWVLPAGATVTFQRPRLGHYLADAPDLCGSLFVKDIGLEKWVRNFEPEKGLRLARITPTLEEMKAYGSVWAEGLSKKAQNHKYANGHAFIVAGGAGKGGAARLAARGALRIGAGVVTVGPPQSAIVENAMQLNAIMLRPVDDAAALSAILPDDRINALVLGPGMGVGKRTTDMVLACLSTCSGELLTFYSGEAGRGAVLDADALTSFEDAPELLFAATREKRVVLTPHAGEFARLFPDLSERLSAQPLSGPAYSKFDAACEAAKRAGCIVLLKGADTVVASPDGDASIIPALYERACPWLATAGAGDVLAGMIAGLLARGFDPAEAAETAAWLHQQAAISFGPGLIAEDLPEELPKVFRALGV